MDRIYMNRIEGQRRIHVEITDNEVSDLLEDLPSAPDHYDSTAAFLALLDAAEETFSPVVAEGRRDRAARQASGPQPDTAVCGSRSLPTSSGNVVSCVLNVGHARQCQSATEYPYVSWPNPSHGVWNPAAGLDDGQPAVDDRRRLAAVERLVSGRPGYHQITVKELLTAMSDAVEEDETR